MNAEIWLAPRDTRLGRNAETTIRISGTRRHDTGRILPPTARHRRPLHHDLEQAAQPPRPRHGDDEAAAIAGAAQRAATAAMIARFHTTGEAYDSRKRRCELRTPRHHAEITSRPAPGKRMRTRCSVSARFSGDQSCDTSSVHQPRRREFAEKHDDRDRHAEQREQRAGEAPRLLFVAVRRAGANNWE